MKVWALLAGSLALACLLLCCRAQQCGSQAGGALCPDGKCCSEWGYCGCGDTYCGTGCQSQCDCGVTPSPPPPPTPPVPPSPIADIVSQELFEEMLLHRNDAICPGRGFYTYYSFIVAAESYPEFGTVGDLDTRKREIAAFLAQTSHETTGGWETAPDGPYSWGYCYLEETPPTAFCVPVPQWPCAPGKNYSGRGPIQISYNYNYGPAGEALGVDLLNQPELVSSNATISFETAFWFWMTPQSPKPSCHDVITEKWTPSPADIAVGRVPGYGMTTNIINGGLECGGSGPVDKVEDRIGYYKRYCDLLNVSYGPEKLDCYNMQPYYGLNVRGYVNPPMSAI